jgi:penicillin-binding protein 1C
LLIEGINDRATIARAPGSVHAARLQLRALGTDARVQWLLDGRWIAETIAGQAFQYDYDETGDHVVTALAEDGAWARTRFHILR